MRRNSIGVPRLLRVTLDKATMQGLLIQRLVFPPRGRPREYPECSYHPDRSHRWSKDRCLCGHVRTPEELLQKLLAVLRAEPQYRVVRAVGRLNSITDRTCDRDS